MTKYMFISFLFVLATVTGCAELERELIIKRQNIEEYPFTLCDENESLLICDSAELTNCHGYLKDKPLMLEEDL